MNRFGILNCCGSRLKVHMLVVTIGALLFVPCKVLAGGKTNQDTIKICGSDDFYISLNTRDTVFIDLNKPYTPETVEVYSSVYGTKDISVTKTSNVNPFVPGTYEDCYEATDADGNKIKCCRTVMVRDVQTSSVKDVGNPGIRIWPNPAKDKIHIDLSELTGTIDVNVSLYAVDGKQVASVFIASGEPTEISTRALGLSSGIYTLEVTSSAFHMAERLVVE